MANVKIRVIADADNAIKNIQKVMDEGLGADKSLTSLGNTLAKLEAKQRKGEDVSEEYNKTLAITEAQFIRNRNAALAAGKGYEGAAKAAEKYKQALFNAGATDAASIFDVYLRDDVKTAGKLQAEQIAEKTRKQREYADALAKVQEEQRKVNEAVERGMVLAKDDPAEKLKYEYNQLEKQLRENIEVQVELANSGGKWSVAMQDQKNKAKVLSERMKELQKEMSKVARTPLNERMRNLVKSFVSAQVVVYGIRKALSFVTDTLKESAKAAAYAEETYNLFATTFEQVGITAQKTAYQLSHSLGIATSSAQKALGVFGDLLKGYGATDAEALKFAESAARTALDIISFKNIVGSTDEIMQSFASGLAGNVENFRKLGYVITQAEIKTLLAKKGLDGLTGSALQQAQVQARLELVMKKATNAIGDMEKTLDSTVNVERRLNEAWLEYKENLGQDVNKIMSPLKKWWLDILETTNKANEAKNRFLKGDSTSGIYDLRKASDMNLFQSSLQNATTAPWYWGINGMNSEKAYPLLEQVIRLFSAGKSDIETALKSMHWDTSLDSDLYERLLNLGELIDKESKDRQDYESRYSALSSMAQDFQGILDKLSGLSGVELTGDLSNHLFNISANANTTESAGLAARNMRGIVSNAFGEALQGISEADWTEFVSPVELALGKATEQSGLEGKMSELETLYEMVYNFSLKDGDLSEKEEERLQAIIVERQKVIDQLEDFTKAEEARKKAEADAKALEKNKQKATEQSITQTQKFIDTLKALNGGTTTVNVGKYLDMENFGGIDKAGLSALASQAVDEIISSMGDADWSDFVSPIEKALEGITDKGSLISAKDELESFYATLYTWAIKDEEISESEASQLDSILKIRQKAIKQLKELTDAEEEKLQSEADAKMEMETTITQTQEFIDSLNKLNMGKTLANVGKYLSMDDFGGIDKAGLAESASSAIEEVLDETVKAYDWSIFVSPIEQALEDITKQDELTAAISELKTFYTLTYTWAMQDGELNEAEEKQLKRIVAIRQAAVRGLKEEEKAEEERLERENAELEFKKFGKDMLGDLNPIIGGFKEAVGSFSTGDWWTSLFSPLTTMTKLAMDSAPIMTSFLGTIMKLVSQLEIVQKLSSIFAETILPVMNQLLSPLMPVIENLFYIIREYLTDYLQPFYTLISAIAPMLNMILEACRPLLAILNILRPVIDGVAKAIGLIAGLVGGTLRFIEDSLKWLAGWIMKGVLGLVNGIIDVLNMIPFVHLDRVDTSTYDDWAKKDVLHESFKDGFDAVQDAINESNKFLFNIENNTDNSKSEKLKYLAELYKGGLLSAEEYYAQKGSVTGDRWDRVKFHSNGTYYNADGYTVARYGDVTIHIDGTELSPEQVAEAIEEVLRPGAKSFQMAY